LSFFNDKNLLKVSPQLNYYIFNYSKPTSPNSNGDGHTHHVDAKDQRKFTDTPLIEQTSNNPVTNTKQQQNAPNFFTTTKTDNFVKKFEQQNLNFAPPSSSSSSASASNQMTNGNKSNLNKETLSRSGEETSSRKEERLDRMPWFHGLLTRENAEKLLVRDGDYLVRETNKAEKQYVLSGRYKGECRHIFLVDPSGVVSKQLFFIYKAIFNFH
jgi:hypothetical protein